jgi:hypothetical protein
VGPPAATVRLGPRVLGQAPPCLTTSHGKAYDSYRPIPRVRESWDGALGSGGEGSSPRVLEMARKDLASVREHFPMRVIMLVMRIEGESPQAYALED